MLHIGTTKNGCRVYVDMELSHAATHFKDSPKLLDAVKKAIPNITATEEEIRIDIDTGVTAGNSDLVETNPDDEIVYAMRPFRDRYSRFVKGKSAMPTSWITLALNKSGDSSYQLYTAFVGKITPSFPGGDYLPEQSKSFWSKHALVWGNQEIVPGTETSVCPW
jgi:hypothetical protein